MRCNILSLLLAYPAATYLLRRREILKELNIQLFTQYDEGRHILEIENTTRNYAGSIPPILSLSLCLELTHY